MTKSEIIEEYKVDDSIGKYSRYLVRLKDETKDDYYVSYYVSIHPQVTEVFEHHTHLVKNKKIIKLVIDELTNFLSNNIIPIKSCIDVIEDKLKGIERDLRLLLDNKQAM